MTQKQAKGPRKPTLEQQFLTRHERQKSTLGFICYGKILKIPAPALQASQYQLKHDDQILKKLDIMLVYNASDAEALKDHIRVKTHIKAQGLTAIEKLRDRPVVFTPAVQTHISKVKPADVEVLFRTGHIVRGKCIGQSKFNLLLQIGTAKLLAYKHGIHHIEVFGTWTETEQSD